MRAICRKTRHRHHKKRLNPCRIRHGEHRERWHGGHQSRQVGVEHHHSGAVPDRIPRRVFGCRRHVEPERGEKPGRGDRRLRRVHRVLHLHHRDTDIVRVRVESPEEDVSGHHNEFRRHVHVHRRGRHSTALLDRLSEREQIHQRDFRKGHRHHCGRVVRAVRSRLLGGHRVVVHTLREGDGVRLRATRSATARQQRRRGVCSIRVCVATAAAESIALSSTTCDSVRALTWPTRSRSKNLCWPPRRSSSKSWKSYWAWPACVCSSALTRLDCTRARAVRVSCTRLCPAPFWSTCSSWSAISCNKRYRKSRV